MAELLKSLYEHTEGHREAESVTSFLTRFVKENGEMEDKFLEAVHDTRLEGFREGYGGCGLCTWFWNICGVWRDII